MSRIDEIKEGNAWWRLVFGLLAVISASLVAWLAEQYGSGKLRELSRYSEGWWLTVGAGFLLVYMVVMLVTIQRIMVRKLKELGELQ